MNTNVEQGKALHTGEFLELRRNAHWEYVRRVRGAGGAAFLIATTQAREIVLVEQHRIPVGRSVLELPAGIVGDEDSTESCLQAAHRELLEETGFAAGHAEVLFDGPTTAGITSEWAWFIRMTGLRRVHAGGGVDDEDIRTHLLPLQNVDHELGSMKKAGLAIDVRVFAALHWLQMEEQAAAKPAA